MRAPNEAEVSLSRRNAFRMSSAPWNRSRASFSRQRLTMRSSSGGKSVRTRVSGSGASRRMDEMMSADVWPVKGRRPAARNARGTSGYLPLLGTCTAGTWADGATPLGPSTVTVPLMSGPCTMQ